MKKLYKDYLNNKLKLATWQKIGVACLIIVMTGLFGWIYEYIFYYFNGGMKVFYWRGGNFLPWINIYAIGSVMILILTHKVKKKPWLIFLIAFISTGILEYFTGLAIYKLFDGARYWDYNTEILNFGNIGGFVCLRSVSFFGLSALLLVYLMVPFCIYLSKKMNKKLFLIISITLCTIFLADELYNLVFSRIFGLPRAPAVYEERGIPFVHFF